MKNAQRDVFALCGLTHVVTEEHLHHGMEDRFVAGVRDVAVDVADGGSDEILRGAHLKIRNFQV